ncbi:MAG TPA: Stp1/IreP family PP2C-type Ser/Thr phosphatase [Kofleriaceae bacterium]|nr:Stp1/IreP family PP2C-type Ser/Thr phosphatase [Kofleriaceae bacterium]
MTQTVSQQGIRVAGDTNVGKVRTTNEDSMIVDPVRGLYVVLDGMGGANAGDVASQTARDAIREFVMQRRMTMEPRALLEAAIQHASATVWNAAQQVRERHGMGTTVVGCIVVDPKRAVVAHVGDSRAYLLRNGRVQMLTRDHTIVEELVDKGLLSAEEAERHPYKNVLSRNLGAKPEAKVDTITLELKAGDRLLLCSDGLYGYASAEAIQYLLGSGDAPEHVARDLIDLALRGGGGDNVTTIVIETPQPPPSSTEVVRTTGAMQWWQRRSRFLQVAKDRGLTKNPIVRGLDPEEALELIASSLCQAIFHDLEKSTGVNVWTFAQNIAGGWFERSGDWAPLRALMDILATSARVVVDEIGVADANLGFLLSIAVSRALVVAELAIGGLLADRLNRIDAELIKVHAAMQETIEGAIDTSQESGLEDTGDRFIDRPTVPFMRPDRPVTNPNVSAELIAAIEKTITIARGRTSQRAELLKQILGALETIAIDATGNFASAVLAARDIYGVRPVDDTGVMPLYDALDQARIITAASVHQISASDALRAKVLRALSGAHQRLVGATTGLVLEAVAPYSERLREVQAKTAEMRDQVAKFERKRADLERKYATTIDHSQPWEKRGTTEW